MKVLITGGGTGGHVYPAISIADEIKKRYKDVDILFIGTEKGLESDVVPKAGYKFKPITVKGFRRKISIDTIKTFSAMIKGFFQAKKILKEFKPDIIVGTGGYVVGPVMLQGFFMGIKTIVHEQNAIPGITVKILSKFVNLVLLSYEESEEYFKKKNNLILTGNPVRKEFSLLDKSKCRKDINIGEDIKFIFSVGGSGGAKGLNDAAINLIKKYNNSEKISMIHVTGKLYYDKFNLQLENENIVLGNNIQVLKYAYDIPKYMKAADIMISRAGALILSEIAIVGIPSVLIPSPNVAHNHQEYNARVFEKKGAAIMIAEKDLKEDSLFRIIEEHIYLNEHLEMMSKNAKKLGILKACENIVDETIKML